VALIGNGDALPPSLIVRRTQLLAVVNRALPVAAVRVGMMSDVAQ